MRELREALADLNAIRVQVARGTQFRGYGPTSIAVTGALALTVALAQSLFLSGAEHHIATFLALWISTAVVAVAVSAWETFSRTQRFHPGFSRVMIQSAVEQFMPSVVVGLLLTVVLLRVASDEVWMLPGLWEIAFSLGIFASGRFLPRPMFGAFGRASRATSVAFVAPAALEDGLTERLAVERALVPVADVRGRRKTDLPENGTLPRITVEPDTFTVRVDGEVIELDPVAELPMAQRYFLF